MKYGKKPNKSSKVKSEAASSKISDFGKGNSRNKMKAKEHEKKSRS